MRTAIDDLISQLRRIKPETILMRSVTDEALEVASDINREQLNRGELSDGGELNNYSKATEGYNSSRKTTISSSERIKFKDTGAFHKSIKAKITKDGVLQIKSGSKKAILAQEYVEDKGYSGNVLGLQEEWEKKWYETYVHETFKRDLIDRILGQ
jgi:hypothetical protein